MADAAQRFADAVVRGDAAALGETLATVAVLRSPITRSARFEGRERIVALYRDVIFSAIEDIAVEQIAADGDVRVLFGTGRAGGRSLEETTVVRLDGDGQIAELTLFVRDLASLAALAAALGPRVASSRPRALAMRAITAPLAWLLRRGDRAIARLGGVA